MALNKRKVLDAARKHAQKGAKAKALKEYNKLLQADPRDTKLLLEVGDAYRRWGQPEEAIGQYSKVAAQYRQDGFDARAVAVFKQILNLDPKHYASYVSLAELYQRMGLDSEAVAALQTAADGYHKEGRKSEALALLRQMAALDPSNTTSRIKVAELLVQEELADEAFEEFAAVAGELSQQEDRDTLIGVQERMLELRPDHLETLNGVARNLMATSEFARAEPHATHALDLSTEPPQYELLIDLYAQMGNDERFAELTRELAKLYRDRGDEDRARDLMQKLPSEDVVSPESRAAIDLSESEEPQLGDEELLDDDPFMSLGDASEAMPAEADDAADAAEEIQLEAEAPPAVTSDKAAADLGALPTGDPEQLLAEASVYLRYGKRDQAIHSLRGVLAQVPEHGAALEKLGDALAEAGESQEAVDAWLRAAEVARLAGDAGTVDSLRARIEEVDPAMAAGIGPVLDPGESADEDSVPSLTPVPTDLTEESPPPPLEFDLDVEADLDLDEAIEEVAEGESVTNMGMQAESDPDPADADNAFEIELDDVSLDDFEIETDAEPDPGIDTSTERVEMADGAAATDADDDAEIEFELDPEDLGGFDAEADAEVGADQADEEDDAGAVESAAIEEEVEEAEFYVAQDMFDEARAILDRVLAAVPGHAQALVLMAEVAASSGPSEATESAPEPEAPDVAADTDAALDVSDETDSADETELDDDDFEIDVDLDAELAAASEEAAAELDADDLIAEAAGIGADDETDEDEASLAAAEAEAAVDVEDEASADTNVEDDAAPATDSEDEAGLEVAPDPDDEPVEEEAPEAPEIAAAEAAEPEPVDAAEAPPEQAEITQPGEGFDLREALADVLEDDPVMPSNDISGVLSTVEDGFESIFSDFKKGVSATLDEGDFDTRYDLGIAYREMGLFDDAIGEFRFCLESPERRFDSLYLMGLCARDLQRWDDAVAHLEQALALPKIPDERMAGVYFDLSIAQEGAGDRERSIASIRKVIEIETDFPGAADRLQALESGTGTIPDVADPGDTYENFDDLFGDGDDADGDEDLVESAPAEVFESFDDVVAEVNADDEAAEAEDAEEDDPEPKGGKRRGRKKISFV